MARQRARELAFRTLFRSERGSEPLLEAWRSVRIELAEEPEEPADAVYGDVLDLDDLAFAEGILERFDEGRLALDAQLEAAITGWSFSQMSQTDLNVLRIAITEMRYGTEPAAVVIEMAVRLAKKFGGDESGRFVNGVLAKLLRATPEAGEANGNGSDADSQPGQAGVEQQGD